MKKQVAMLTLVAVVLTVSGTLCFAQPPEGGRGGRGGFGGRGGGGLGMFGRGVNPLMAALDKDNDGELSVEEIQQAVAAIKALDKDNDGKISAEELRPRMDAAAMVERFMAYDEDKDGKITLEELPEQMARMMEQNDTNADGALDKAEIQTMAETMAQRFGQFGQGRGGRGGRGGPGGDGGGNRPQRPNFGDDEGL
jgi:Ca2+-binding EF-hand superfamily protein